MSKGRKPNSPSSSKIDNTACPVVQRNRPIESPLRSLASPCQQTEHHGHGRSKSMSMGGDAKNRRIGGDREVAQREESFECEESSATESQELNTSIIIKEGNAEQETDKRSADRDTSIAVMHKRMKSDRATAPTEVGTEGEAAPDIPLRKLIPPRDCPRIRRMLEKGSMLRLNAHAERYSGADPSSPIGGGPSSFGWTAVIARARSHPHEAAEPHFFPAGPSSPCQEAKGDAANDDESDSPSSPAVKGNDGILTYKPLHAMLKYDPPLDAVEAVLRAHPEAVLDVTFEGTALRIAAESHVSSMLVLRLLLVAEMAMRRRTAHQRLGRRYLAQARSAEPSKQECFRTQGRDIPVAKANCVKSEDPEQKQPLNEPPLAAAATPEAPAALPSAPNIQRDPGVHTVRSLLNPYPNSGTFSGHNPITWITERRVPVKITAMLLKWYPIGAIQRPRDEDCAPVGDEAAAEAIGMGNGGPGAESPLIKIVDDFARDHYNEGDTEDVTEGGDGGYNADSEEESYCDSVSDHEDGVWPGTTTTTEAAAEEVGTSEAAATQPQLRPSLQTYQLRECIRKEKRWEKFLHILYATDMVLQSTRPWQVTPTAGEEDYDGPPASPKAQRGATDVSASCVAPAAATSSSFVGAGAASTLRAASSSSEDCGPKAASPTATTAPAALASTPMPFHPVHAWVRCLTSPRVGLQHCRPYGAWSVLRVMGRRIPSEFGARDASDGGRTAFQTLAEKPAADCRLCLGEVRDVVECLVDADHRSAFLPRKGDGRLIGHVAMENGWPCKDLFSRKKSATCA